MGHILSVVDAINKLRFKPLKTGQIVSVDEVMPLSNGTAIVKLKDGSFSIIGVSFSANLVNHYYAVLGYGASEPSQTVLYGLARMGVITRAQAREHIKRVKQREKESKHKHAIQRLKSACEELGIDPPDILA